jgi:hypothetical protein
VPDVGDTVIPAGEISVNWTGLVEFIEYPFLTIAVMLMWLDTPGNSGPKLVAFADTVTKGMEAEPELSNVAV